MAGVVGFEPTVHGIKTRGYCCQDSHNPLNSSYDSHASYELSEKSRKLLSKVLSKSEN